MTEDLDDYDDIEGIACGLVVFVGVVSHLPVDQEGQNALLSALQDLVRRQH